jgi:hypothetical protein
LHSRFLCFGPKLTDRPGGGFYLGLGFTETGRVEEGEIVLGLPLEPDSGS